MQSHDRSRLPVKCCHLLRIYFNYQELSHRKLMLFACVSIKFHLQCSRQLTELHRLYWPPLVESHHIVQNSNQSPCRSCVQQAQDSVQSFRQTCATYRRHPLKFADQRSRHCHHPVSYCHFFIRRRHIYKLLDCNDISQDWLHL